MVVDVIAGIILLASIIISILRGFVREVLTIFGIVGGALAAYIGGPLLAPTVSGWLGITEEGEELKFFDIVPYTMLADWLAFGAVFIIFVIIFSIISHFLASSVKNVGLGAVDRTLGMVFGLVRGVLFLGLLYLPVFYLVDEDQSAEWGWLNNSKSRVYLEATSGWISGFIPEDKMETIAEATEELGEMNEARKKLEELNVLTPMPEGIISMEGDDTVTMPEGGVDEAVDPEGYSEDTRNDMDKLFERMNQE